MGTLVSLEGSCGRITKTSLLEFGVAAGGASSGIIQITIRMVSTKPREQTLIDFLQ